MARAIATATITFGLVSIPVKLYVSASGESVSFNQISPGGNRVRQKLVDAVTGAEVERDKLLKGFEYAKDQFVTFTSDELKALDDAAAPKTVDVVEFVPATSIDPVSIEKTYYLGVDKGGDKGYALLAETLRGTETVAVAQWNKGGRVHLVTITEHKGGLVMRVMFYAAEVRDFAEVLDGVAKLPISDAERAMAVQLVGHLAKPTFDASRFADAYAAKVREAVEAKAAGGSIAAAPAAPNTAILDVFAALKASLEAAGKKTAEPPPAEAPPKTKAKKSRKKVA